jgi:hypothetical protein
MTEHEHCFHQTEAFSNSAGTTWRGVCCWCGRVGIRHDVLQRPDGHGPNAPKVLVKGEWEVKP